MISCKFCMTSIMAGAAPALAFLVFAQESAQARPQAGRVQTVSTYPVAFPERPAGAPGGYELLSRLKGMPLAEREDILVEQITSGNVPTSMRRLVPVRLVVRGEKGRSYNGTAWVLGDYLAVGSDADYVHVPLSLPAARRVASALGLTLPTVPLVNAIYEQADIKLRPKPLPPSNQMTSIAYMLRHQQLVAQQLVNASSRRPPHRPTLIAGHKKDVVNSKRLIKMRDRVAIFGWHTAIAKPIQPLSTVHDELYVDYSHGIRLVSPVVRLDARAPKRTASVSDEDAIAPAPQHAVIFDKRRLALADLERRP